MPLPSGSRLGPYEIVALLGVGGMGEVYRARDSRLDRTVAIKLLAPHIATAPGFRERFEREARALSAVEHPHICALYDIGVDGGVAFLVMQYIDGETLADRIGRGPIPASEAVAVARQIAAGLEAAHERGILHRDLKPSNIKLTPDGKVKILDFGLAKTLTPAVTSDEPTMSRASLPAGTQTGVILGTAPYMSPEQARGKPVDKGTDVWAFGCVLFEMLAGRPSFDGETLTDVLAAVVGREPEWSALPANMPWRVRDLLRRCLRKDPTRRPRDIRDIRLELEEAEAAEPDRTAADRPASGRRWSTLVSWSVTAVALLVAAGAVVTSRSRAPGNPGAMRFSTVTNFAGVEAQPSLSPDGRSVAFVSKRDGQWDIYIGLVTGGSLIRITNDPNVKTRPRWSPDGTRLLFARLNAMGLNDIWVVPALGGAARRIILNGTDPTWSPDGRSIGYSSGGGIWISDASGANPRAVTRPEPPLGHYQAAFSRDGRSLAFVRRRDMGGPYGELAVASVGTGTVKTLTSDGAFTRSPVWSPDDRFIYFTSSRGGTLNIWKLPAASGEPEQITAGQGDDADIDLSADGTRLVFSSVHMNVNLAEMSLAPASGGKMKWLTTDSARGESAPRYSPDGRRIAYFSNRNAAEKEGIWVMDADGANASKLVEDDRVNIFPRWSADGQDLLFTSRPSGMLNAELRRVSVAGGAPQALPIEPWGPPWGDVAGDGRLIYRTSESAGELYDPATNRRQPIANLLGDPFWSRDGQSFAFAKRPDAGEPSDAGLWTETPGGAHRQIFPGWVVWFAWAGADVLLVAEGKPDLKGVLWRVDTDGRREVVLSELPLFMRYPEMGVRFNFDVHPDGRRIVLEALEFFESDIAMIDNVR